MRTNIAALPAGAAFDALAASLRVDPAKGPQRLYPIVDERMRLLGVVTRVDLQQRVDERPADVSSALEAIVRPDPIVVYPDDPLRMVVHKMAETGLTRFPVVDRGPERRLLGMIALDDLLKARARNLDSEQRRERVLRVRFPFVFSPERR